jgi:hypothetical protein
MRSRKKEIRPQSLPERRVADIDDKVSEYVKPLSRHTTAVVGVSRVD